MGFSKFRRWSANKCQLDRITKQQRKRHRKYLFAPKTTAKGTKGTKNHRQTSASRAALQKWDCLFKLFISCPWSWSKWICRIKTFNFPASSNRARFLWTVQITFASYDIRLSSYSLEYFCFLTWPKGMHNNTTSGWSQRLLSLIFVSREEDAEFGIISEVQLLCLLCNRSLISINSSTWNGY